MLGRMFGSSNERLVRSLGFLRPRSTPEHTVIPGSLLEQAHRVGLRQRCKPVVHLVDDPERFAARREDVESREAGGEILDELGHSRHDVLAVVEHQENIAIGQPASERFLVRLTARPLHAHLSSDLASDEIR